MDGALAVQRYLNHRLFELMQSQGRAFLDQLHKKVALAISFPLLAQERSAA